MEATKASNEATKVKSASTFAFGVRISDFNCCRQDKITDNYLEFLSCCRCKERRKYCKCSHRFYSKNCTNSPSLYDLQNAFILD